MAATTNGTSRLAVLDEEQKKHYREMLRHTLSRLLLFYMTPFLLLLFFFYLENIQIYKKGVKSQLLSIASHQSYILDQFLSERVANLNSVSSNRTNGFIPNTVEAEEMLKWLQSTSDTFVDLSYFNSQGDLVTYSGPHPELTGKNYSNESWYINLKNSEDDFIITDIYQGFRDIAHFTIAIKRWVDNDYYVIRAVLSPSKIHEFLLTSEDTGDLSIDLFLVNHEGLFQVCSGNIGSLRAPSHILPPKDPWVDVQKNTYNKNNTYYSYAWSQVVPWTIIVQEKPKSWFKNVSELLNWYMIAFTVIILGIEFIFILNRAQNRVKREIETEQTEAELSGQLVHASKLASVGELAAGIAHEINNPLAIISEEAGLIKDLTNPEFSDGLTNEQLYEHLDVISRATYRCRDITRKLLGFVRQNDIKLEWHDVHSIVEEVLDGLLGSEFHVSSLNVVRDFNPDMPEIYTDRNQLIQVILNLCKNALDAMGDNVGTLTLHTDQSDETITISVSDTGCGMTKEQVAKIFSPFFTTKEVGKGTGLGLSVSLGIIRSMGGEIYVNSKLGEGSRFTIKLPVDIKKDS